MHIYFLIEVRNRFIVAFTWLWDYITWQSDDDTLELVAMVGASPSLDCGVNQCARVTIDREVGRSRGIHAHDPARCNHVHCFIPVNHRRTCRWNVVRYL